MNPISNWRDARLAPFYVLTAIPAFTWIILGPLLGRLIAPSMGRLFVSKDINNPKSYGKVHKYKDSELLPIDNYTASHPEISYSPAGDRVELDSKMLKHTASAALNKERHIIVYFCGKRDVYQSSEEEVRRDMMATGADAFMFNYRGGGSSGSSAPKIFQDMVDDAKAVLKRLIEDGYNPKNMILKGHSTGGPIMLAAASQLLKEDKIKVGGCFADRPFSSITDVIRSNLRQLLYFRALGDYITYGIIYPLLRSSKWEGNALDNYKFLVESKVPVALVNIHAKTPEGGVDIVIREGSLLNAVANAQKDLSEKARLRSEAFRVAESVIDKNTGHAVAMADLEHMVDGKSETANEYFDRFCSGVYSQGR